MSMQRAAYYVLMIGTGRPCPLNLEPKTLTDARRAIRWQIRGGEEPARFALTRYDASAKLFREVSSQRIFDGLKFDIYTPEAKAGFFAALPR